MSGEPADEPEVISSPAPRRRRALRVPIIDIPRASMLDNGAAAGTTGDGAPREVSNVLELDPPSGVTFAVDPSDDREPTEPSFMTIADPLLGCRTAGRRRGCVDAVHRRPFQRAAQDPSFDDASRHCAVQRSAGRAFPRGRGCAFPKRHRTAARRSPGHLDSDPEASASASRFGGLGAARGRIGRGRTLARAFLWRGVPTDRSNIDTQEVAVECGFIERALRVPVGSKILDVGCGLGVQTVELASRGYHMVGLDISPTMVARAYDEAEDRGLQIDFVRGDMREVTFEEPFDAMLCWGTTFGYFSEEENELTIRKFHDSIRPHGTLLLEVVNRDFMIGSQPNQVWFEVDSAVCMEETDFDYATSRLRVKRRVANHSGQQNDRLYSIRLYALHEICALLEQNGFRVDEISGREATLGIFFGVHSPKMIIRAERLPGSLKRASSIPPVRPSTAPSVRPSAARPRAVVRPSVPLGALKPSQFPPESTDED